MCDNPPCHSCINSCDNKQAQRRVAHQTLLCMPHAAAAVQIPYAAGTVPASHLQH